MKSLLESIFSDNVKSAIKINGMNIYEPEWKQCQEFFEKRRKKYFKNLLHVKLGDMQDPYTVAYNEDDCIICIGEDEKDLYILCPETIYMCHEASELHGRSYSFSLTNIDEANDFDISFNWYQDSRRGWMWIGGVYSGKWAEEMEKAGFESSVGYIPVTISKNAQNIIKNYIK